MNAVATLEAVSARVDDVLAELARQWQKPTSDLGAVDLPHLVGDAARGGKLLRPEMAHWGFVATGADPLQASSLVELGAALELLHLFALIHDDVMDRSEQRRGEPALHARARTAHQEAGAHGDAQEFGNNIAILAGDLLHAEASHLTAPLPPGVRDVWLAMMRELVLGQHLDLTGAALARRDLNQALTVAHLKSGAYTVQRPLQMGALLGDASEALLACLRTYGHHAGLAFALRDDLLGTFGDGRLTGKPTKDDLADGKATALLALAEERLDGRGTELLGRTGDGDLGSDELEELRDLMLAAGIRDEVEQMVTREVEAAEAALDRGHVEPAAVTGLVNVVRRLGWRQS